MDKSIDLNKTMLIAGTTALAAAGIAGGGLTHTAHADTVSSAATTQSAASPSATSYTTSSNNSTTDSSNLNRPKDQLNKNLIGATNAASMFNDEVYSAVGVNNNASPASNTNTSSNTSLNSSSAATSSTADDINSQQSESTFMGAQNAASKFGQHSYSAVGVNNNAAPVSSVAPSSVASSSSVVPSSVASSASITPSSVSVPSLPASQAVINNTTTNNTYYNNTNTVHNDTINNNSQVTNNYTSTTSNASSSSAVPSLSSTAVSVSSAPSSVSSTPTSVSSLNDVVFTPLSSQASSHANAVVHRSDTVTTGGNNSNSVPYSINSTANSTADSSAVTSPTSTAAASTQKNSKPANETPMLPQTGENNADVYAAVAAGIISLSTAMYLIAKRRKQKLVQA